MIHPGTEPFESKKLSVARALPLSETAPWPTSSGEIYGHGSIAFFIYYNSNNNVIYFEMGN